MVPSLYLEKNTHLSEPNICYLFSPFSDPSTPTCREARTRAAARHLRRALVHADDLEALRRQLRPPRTTGARTRRRPVVRKGWDGKWVKVTHDAASGMM